MRPIDTQKLALQALAGHGHVKPRPDGAVMRCGGPAICKVCQQEKAQMEMGAKVALAFHPLNGQHINQGSVDAAAEAYEREFLQAKIDVQAAEIARLRESLNLALEYWSDRQQRYKNRVPVWVQKARAALLGEPI